MQLLDYLIYFIFTGEFVLKIVGFGSKYFFFDWFNWTDCVIVVLTTMDVLFVWLGVYNLGAGFRVLRASRVLRILRLMKLNA